MPKDHDKPVWRRPSVQALAIAVAAAALLGYAYSQWDQPPAVPPQEPIQDDPGVRQQ